MNPARTLAAWLAFASAPLFAAEPAPAPGRSVYQSVCIACHAVENVMVAAPKLGDTDQWRQRLARAANGIETLTENAVQGLGAMPPKGGAAHLSRAEVRNAITYMMAVERPSGAGHSPSR